MTRIARVCLIALCMSLALPAAASPRPAKPSRVAVLPFTTTVGSLGGKSWLPQARLQMQDVFVTELRQTQLSPLSRGQLGELVRKNRLTLSGDVDSALRRTLASHGVRYAVTTKVSGFGVTDRARKQVTLAQTTSVIDTTTGEVEFVRSARASQISVGGFGGGVDDERLFAALAAKNAKATAAGIGRSGLGR